MTATEESLVTEAAAPVSPARTDKSPRRDPEWPALTALVTSVFLPVTTARRTQHVPLRRAWAVHFAGGWLVVILIFLLVAWSETRASLDPARVALEFIALLDEVAHTFDPHPSFILLPIIGITLWVEAALIGIAFMLMSWGARDERLRTSFANSLRRVWLHLAGVWPLVLMIASIGILVEANARTWRSANPSPMPDYPRPPTLSPSDPAYQQKFQAYNAAIREYQKQYRAAQGRIDKWRGTQPWYVREWEVIPVGLSFAGGLWILLSALRAVGAPRRSTPLERPPTCDACGYNLTTMPVDSRCPECGEPVAASLGPDVRPGSPWRHRRTRGRWEAWKRCAAGAVLHTRAFARQLPLTRAGADHRSFLAVQLPVVFIIGVLALYGLHALKTPAGRFPESWAVILALTSAFGMGCVAGTVGVTVGAATLVGFIQSFKAGRNLLPGAIQVACYLAPYLMFWAMFGAVTALTVLKLEETGIFRAAQELTRFHRDILAFMTWLIPNLAWALWHTVLVARGTVAMRYANR